MKVLLVDDHPLFLEGLKNLLTARGIQVVGEVHNGAEAIQLAQRLQPDVILMDIQMPVLDGLAATRVIHAEMPEIRIVMLTMSAEDKNLFEAIRSGAFGYLLKTLDTEEFFQHMLALTRGEAPLSPGLAARILREFGRQARPGNRPAPMTEASQRLSDRQVEVLKLVAQGLTYKEVGAKLHLSERTIKYHMGEIIQRLHLKNRAQVVKYVRRMGYI